MSNYGDGESGTSQKRQVSITPGRSVSIDDVQQILVSIKLSVQVAVWLQVPVWKRLMLRSLWWQKVESIGNGQQRRSDFLCLERNCRNHPCTDKDWFPLNLQSSRNGQIRFDSWTWFFVFVMFLFHFMKRPFNCLQYTASVVLFVSVTELI